MASTRTAEEVEQNHIECLGDELGSVYHRLWNELSWLYARWNEYVELFGTKQSRVELVNKAAGTFFRFVQDALFDETLLHISRITDPPQSVGKDNLTIRLLPDLVQDEALRAKVNVLIETVIKQTEFCRDWRNRRLAHKDLSLAMEDGAEPLIPASRAKVKDALLAITAVLNAISGHYMDSTTMFEGGGFSARGAVSLLYVLDDGLRAEAERQKRLKAGEYRADDYGPRDL